MAEAARHTAADPARAATAATAATAALGYYFQFIFEL
jgi:hypothetical protein